MDDRPYWGGGPDSSTGPLPVLLEVRLNGLEKRIMDRFDRADEDRQTTKERIDLVEGRLWKIVLGIAVCAIGELLQLLIK